MQLFSFGAHPRARLLWQGPGEKENNLECRYVCIDVALRDLAVMLRPVSGLASESHLSGESPSRGIHSGIVIRLHSLTVAGAAPDLLAW